MIAKLWNFAFTSSIVLGAKLCPRLCVREYYLLRNCHRRKQALKSLPVLKLVDVVHHLLRAVPGVVFVLLLYEDKNRLGHLAVLTTN